jgi:hypothetical protein
MSESLNDILLEGNKKIARYMGYTYYPLNHIPSENHRGPFHPGWKKYESAHNISKFNINHNAFLCRGHNGLAYHRDWNWIMDVVKEIKRKREEYQQSFSLHYLKKELELPLHKMNVFTDILTLHAAIVQYIDWYNEAHQERYG